MADRLLVLVPLDYTHAPRSILEQATKLGPGVTEMRAIKHTMELILCDKFFPMMRRLFDAVVRPTVLYGCEVKAEALLPVSL